MSELMHIHEDGSRHEMVYSPLLSDMVCLDCAWRSGVFTDEARARVGPLSPDVPPAAHDDSSPEG